MRILVTGASGFVGSALTPRLLAAGHSVRALGRDHDRLSRALASYPEVELFIGDARDGASLRRAMEGIDVAYFLVHSMEASEGERFAERERMIAERFATAAAAAAVGRIVYLGGPAPSGRRVSRHLSSRLAVERELLGAVTDSVALRASIVIGARSRSFRLLVRLVERMPILPLPLWRERRSCPIDERDIIAMLVAAADSPAAAGRTLDAAGPEVLTYGAIVQRIADLMLVRRPVLRVPVEATPLIGPIAAAIAGESEAMVIPLMESLATDLMPGGEEDAAALLGVALHRFDAAVEHALREWEQREPLAAR